MYRRSRLLLSGEGCFVVSEVRRFVLDEADQVVNTCFVVVGDLVQGFRKHLSDLDYI